MAELFFSIVVTTYNRSELVMRCVGSCLAQNFPSFEVIVVDDGSTDGTLASLQRLDDSRIRVVCHESNRGIDPARYTGVSHARGEWILVIDSDWELLPCALQRLHKIICSLPPDIRVVRGRITNDDGHTTPYFIPDEPIGYEGRIKWVDAEGGYDDVRCVHKSVFEATPYVRNRRGAMETLYELNLARNETSLHVHDVFCCHHLDAPNSFLRSVDRKELIPRLQREAPDMLWMAETTLREHGDALMKYGSRQYQVILRSAAVQAFLAGKRRRGLHYGLRYLRLRRADIVLWSTLILGLIGPSAVAHGVLVYRLATRIGSH